MWHYRRLILMELGGGNINEEAIDRDLDFADDLGGTNPKNYQLWYHRRALLEIRFKNASDDDRADAAQKELSYVDRILEDDSKNYHVSLHITCATVAQMPYMSQISFSLISRRHGHTDNGQYVHSTILVFGNPKLNTHIQKYERIQETILPGVNDGLLHTEGKLHLLQVQRKFVVPVMTCEKRVSFYL